ncbi:integrase family protein [Pusillimonas sp. T7-7]|uniref:Integrase n=2 Tax=Pseudomonadota TaxID=1224 RepID=A0ABT2R293_9GAMM|nr:MULTISPECIES: integrase [Pseudomonadota]AEC21383.1 integrase family protein [Pusillimonas sp. T7-7]MCU5783822.1 integrase [Alloalcanivorax balearicus MACL04]QXX77926.1 integrase [Alcaligenes ammonioxydans]
MAEIIVFQPRPELDAAQNMRGFITSCRDLLTVFGTDLDFDALVWDVTEYLEIKGRGKKRHRLIFSTLETMEQSDPQPFSEPFLSFSKSYIRYMHGVRPTKNIAFRLAALRALHSALNESSSCNPVHLKPIHFNRAGQMISERYKMTTAYRIAGQLEMAADFLSENTLTSVRFSWRNSLPRPGDAVRIGKEFEVKRLQKIPSQEALDALPKIFRMALSPPDVLFSSVAAILCAAPDRVNEVLSLAHDCEVWEKGTGDDDLVYGLRWSGSKGTGEITKWLIPSMASVVQEAIEKIRRVTSEARTIAIWYEENPHGLYLPDEMEYLRNKDLSMLEVADIIGLSGAESSSRQWCKNNKVSLISMGTGYVARFSDVERAILRYLPASFPYVDHGHSLRFSDALFVVQRNGMHMQRGTYRCMIEPVTIDQINSGFGSRVRHGFPSIFTRLGFAALDGSPLKVTSHQFRHYLNTLAQSGGMSQLDIAKWSGRIDIRQNEVYDHMSAQDMLAQIREAAGNEKNISGSLAKISPNMPVSREDFVKLRFPTAHTTDLGFCVHDFTMSPCSLHRDCIHCEDLVCIKGDESQGMRVRKMLDESRALLKIAQEGESEGYAGSNRWIEHQKSTVERLSMLCALVENPKIRQGAVLPLSLMQKKVLIEKEGTSVSRISFSPKSR